MWNVSGHEYINTIIDSVSIKINDFISEFRNNCTIIHYVLGFKHYEKINNNVFKLKKYGRGRHASKKDINSLLSSLPSVYKEPDRISENIHTSQNNNIQIFDQDYVAYDPEHIYRVIKSYSVKNIFYTGACTNVCILYKDGASIAHMKNNFDGNIFLIGDLTTTLTGKKSTDEEYSNSHEKVLDFYRKKVCEVLDSKQILNRRELWI
jgi:hypothetical protein